MKSVINSKKIMLIMITLLLFIPISVLLVWSFSRLWPSEALFPNKLGLRGWSYLLSPRSKVFSSLAVSLFISFVVTVLGLILSIPAGKALGQLNFPGKNIIEVLILAPIIIPTITIGMGIHIVFIKWGLADKILGVILVQLPLVLPYGVRIFASVFKALGEKWEEQAKTLKANVWQGFWYVVFPLIRPGIIGASILMFNVSFSQYFLTFLIGGGNVNTLPLLLFPFINGGDRVIASGIGLVFIIISLVFMFLLEKALGKGNDNSIGNFYYL